MDPADPATISQTLNAQGALMGRHDSMLQQVMEMLPTLTSNVSQMGQQINLLATQPHAPPSTTPAPMSNPPVASAALPSNSTTRAPFVPPPEHNSGNIDSCGSFLLQCSQVFDI